MMTLLIFIVALGILVTVHEWGHFIVAKKSGVRVDVFSIGFGPKLFGIKWHGTEYRIAPIPFGGYVKIYGQEPMEEAEGDPVKAEEIAKDPSSFHSKPLIKKARCCFCRSCHESCSVLCGHAVCLYDWTDAGQDFNRSTYCHRCF